MIKYSYIHRPPVSARRVSRTAFIDADGYIYEYCILAGGYYVYTMYDYYRKYLKVL